MQSMGVVGNNSYCTFASRTVHTGNKQVMDSVHLYLHLIFKRLFCTFSRNTHFCFLNPLFVSMETRQENGGKTVFSSQNNCFI